MDRNDVGGMQKTKCETTGSVFLPSLVYRSNLRNLRMSGLFASLLALALVLQFSSFVVAQQPTPSPQTKATPPPNAPNTPNNQRPSTGGQGTAAANDDVVRITTNLVQVDAVITGKDGKPVTDLRPEEIRITEDGRAQTVTHFSYVMTESGTLTPPTKSTVAVDKNALPVPPVSLRPEQVRRTMALVVDDLRLSFESTYYVRRALKKFVDEQMQSGDLVAIIRTSGGLGALQQFTSDKRMLYAAIDRVKWTSSGRSAVSAFAPLTDVSDQSEGAAAMRAANEDLDQLREDQFAVGTLGAVRYVVRGLRDLPGRKSILLMSDGLKIRSTSDPTRNYRTLVALQHLIDEAGRASVVIYTMNATGLQTFGLTAADATGRMSADQVESQLQNRRNDAFDSQDGLTFLAERTGGLAIYNNNDLSDGVKRVIEDQKGYYLIGYRPDESTFDPKTGRRVFHKLSVKVLRPGKFNVRMRNGFFGVTDEESNPAPPTAQRQIIKALLSPFGSAGVHVRLTSLFGNDPQRGSLVRSMMHVDARDLTFTDEPDGWHQAVFDVLAVTFGDNGTIVDQVGKTHTVSVKGARYQRMLRDGFVYFVIVIVKKPGAYQLRIALRDHGSERVGSATQFVEVPDVKKNRLLLSSVVLTVDDPEPAKQSAPAAANSDTKAAAADHTEGEETTDPKRSAAVRQFQRGSVMDYGVVIYNARIDKVTRRPQLQTQIRLFHEGKILFTGNELPWTPEKLDDLKRIAVGGALQLGSTMEPGEYVLQVIVTDLLADRKHRTATQWMDFEIR